MVHVLYCEQLLRLLPGMANNDDRRSINFVLNPQPNLASGEVPPNIPGVSERPPCFGIAAAPHLFSQATNGEAEPTFTSAMHSPATSTSYMPRTTFQMTAGASSGPELPVAQPGIVRKRRRKPPTVPCEVCGRLFGQVSAAKKHKRVVHDKIKDWECGICKCRFAEKSNLKKHIQARHQTVRPHKCIECEKVFNFTDGLRRHINNCHLGLRPHQCDFCSMSFKQRTHLRKHRKSIHHATNDI